MAAVEHLHVLYHSADIFHVLWDHWAYSRIFENGVMFMYSLEGVSSVANLNIDSQPTLISINVGKLLIQQTLIFSCHFNKTP